MTTVEIICVIAILLSLAAMGAFNKMRDKDMWAEKELNDRRDAANSKALAHMAVNFAQMNDRINKLAERIEKLEASMKELPMEELDEEIKRMAAWNDGFSEIIGYGRDIPKLNKEGLKHE